MPQANNILQLRQLLAEKFPQAGADTAWSRRGGAGVFTTGVSGLDEVLGGGLPRGGITELICDRPGRGSAPMFNTLLRQVYANQQWLALVDSADAFDPGSVEPEILSRLLWVRCEKFADAFKAVDWIVRDGNLPVVVLDLQLATARQLDRIAATTWYRLQRILEHNHNLLWVLTPRSVAGCALDRVAVHTAFSLEDLDQPPATLLGKLGFQDLKAREGSLRVEGR